MLCSKELNYYNKTVFSAVAKTYERRVASFSGAMRGIWLDTMSFFGHKSDAGFLQLLEKPPLSPGDPNYRSVRCYFFEKGNCELGSSCTSSHSRSAPLSLNDLDKEDVWKK